MSHFEKELYADELPADRLSARRCVMLCRAAAGDGGGHGEDGGTHDSGAP